MNPSVNPGRTLRVQFSEEDAEYVATCDEFASLSWLAPTAAEALDGLRALLRDLYGH